MLSKSLKAHKLIIPNKQQNSERRWEDDRQPEQPFHTHDHTLPSITLMRDIIGNSTIPLGQRQALFQKVATQYGNRTTSRLVASLKNTSTIQRCGCARSRAKCSCQENKQEQELKVLEVQRDLTAPKLDKCGPGTNNPFCFSTEGACKPFNNPEEAIRQWETHSAFVPGFLAGTTGCDDVKPVWDSYFAGTSKKFSFDESSCVGMDAKTEPAASKKVNREASRLFNKVIEFLPTTLGNLTPFPEDGHLAVIRLPLEDAIGPHEEKDLHLTFTYESPATNAAGNLAGGTGRKGEGSDIFGDDDRVISGTVVIEIDAIDPITTAMSGQVRWVPHIHVKDTVDFCPGNLGGLAAQQVTITMSKLEVMGLTRDVPITIDYEADIQERGFNVPFVVPLLPPQPTPTKFPRIGPAKTSGSLLRIRTGPGLQFKIVGKLPKKGTSIEVINQVRGDTVDGNDVWDQIDRGFVSDRYVSFDSDLNKIE